MTEIPTTPYQLDQAFTRLFPKTKFNWPPERQLYKVLDELVEAEQDMIKWKGLHPSALGCAPEYEARSAFLKEVIDVMSAASGVLIHGGYTSREIADGFAAVHAKNAARGYYIPQQTELQQ